MTAITPKQPTPLSKTAVPSTPREMNISIGAGKPKRPRPPKSAPPVLRTASEIMEARSGSPKPGGSIDSASISGGEGYQVEVDDDDQFDELVFDDDGGGDAFGQQDQLDQR